LRRPAFCDGAQIDVEQAAVHHHWAGSYKKTYAELEKTDPIGFEEFNTAVSQSFCGAMKGAVTSGYGPGPKRLAAFDISVHWG
jgi:hypothetical protein